jgi:AcrR family transcriptional regulator
VDKQGLMRINELEKRAGVPKTTIHFYVRNGLLHPPLKTGRTMAYYDETHLKRLKALQELKAQGRLPLSFLKERMAELDNDPDGLDGLDRSPVREAATTTRAKDRKRQEIARAAIKIFSEKGYHQVKIRDIAAALGISTGTFYIYYEDKRALFVDVVDTVIRTILGDAAESIRQEKDIIRRLLLRGKVFYDNYTKYNEILSQLRAEMVGEGGWSREKIKKAYHALTQPVIRDIQRGIESGIFRKVDPDLTAYALTGLIQIMCLRTTIGGEYSFEKIMEFVLDFMLKGLEPEKSGRGGDHEQSSL